MKCLRLNNGSQMPLIGFGTWDVRGKQGEQNILEAIEVGYRLLDTAQMYENEATVGNAIRKSGLLRSELFVTTKLYRPSTSYKKAKIGIEKSLNELQLDYVDLLLIHEPYAQSFEMYEAFKEAYQAGKVRAIGISNFDQKHYDEFIHSCGIIPAVNQVEAHVYFPQLDLQKQMTLQGTQMQAWGPFTEGRRNIFAEPVLQEIGARYGKSAAQVALRFLIQNHIAVIPKSSHKSRMQENFEVFDFTLGEDEMAQIKRMDEGKSLFNWYGEAWI